MNTEYKITNESSVCLCSPADVRLKVGGEGGDRGGGEGGDGGGGNVGSGGGHHGETATGD